MNMLEQAEETAARLCGGLGLFMHDRLEAEARLSRREG